MMKKIVSLLVMILMNLGLYGCDGKISSSPSTNTTNSTKEDVGESSNKNSQSTDTDKKEEDKSIVRIGLGHGASINESSEFSFGTGANAHSTVYIAAVGLDKNGKIQSVSFDCADTKIEFDENGHVISDLSGKHRTMREVSKDRKEFNEKSNINDSQTRTHPLDLEYTDQMDLFEKWVTGKTLSQVLAIKMMKNPLNPKESVPAEPELSGKIKISVDPYIEVLEKAVNTSKPLKVDADAVGLGINTAVNKSRSKTEDKGAVAVMDIYMSVTAMNKDKIAGNILDCMQTGVTYDLQGKMISRKADPILSKQELKEGFNLKSQSPIKKEWYEQANAFSAWMVGKTNEEILKIKLLEDKDKKIIKEEDLTSSITIDVSNDLITIDESIKNSK